MVSLKSFTSPLLSSSSTIPDRASILFTLENGKNGLSRSLYRFSTTADVCQFHNLIDVSHLLFVAILPKDVEHLIKEATDLELHQAINDGLGFVADPTAQLILSRDAFNLWPFATFTFFLQLNHWTFIEVRFDSAKY